MVLERVFDKSNLYEILTNFPKQFRKGLDIAERVEVRGQFRNVIVCGMGGSALAADVLKTYMPVMDMPLIVSRNYNLPFEADRESLVICITFSGNTEETLSSFREALHIGCKVACITTGGKLYERCQEEKIPCAIIPKEYKYMQPRYALGYMFGALTKILANSGIMPPRDNEIMDMTRELNHFNFHEDAQKIAKKLNKKIPIIYSSEKNMELARIWKIKFNETSKIMAFCNYFPELNHNEMSGHINSKVQGDFHSIMLLDKTDHPRITKRMKIMAELLKENGGESTFINLMGDHEKLTKIFSALLFSDWISYYLAMEYRTDPMPIEIVERLKEKLRD